MGTRNEWIFSVAKFGLSKDKLYQQYIQYMLDRTQRMFKYNGLPETIPQRELELLLQVNGTATIGKDDEGNLYAFRGGLGGVPDAYYRPTISVVANPYLKLNKEYKIGEDCEIIINDSMWGGLIPMFSKYANQLVESDITLRMALINARIPSLIVADNDSAKKDAENYIMKVEKGELGIISSNAFFEGIKTSEYGIRSYSAIKDTIEAIQYLKSAWFNELGLNANYNMKREAINDAEAGMNEDSLLPLIDDMLECRRVGLEKVNKMFGTNITVELDSSWKVVQEDYTEEPQEDPKQEEPQEEKENEETV